LAQIHEDDRASCGYCHFALEVAFPGCETGMGSFFDMPEKFWSQVGFDWRSICGFSEEG
jgi:hypothetical protein